MAHWWPQHDADEIEAVAAVLRSGKTNLWTGGECHEFEHEYARFVGSRFATTVSNGTVALEAAIRALSLPEKSSIILPCRTFVACAAAVVNTGHIPVLADIGDDCNVSWETIAPAIADTNKTVGAVMLGSA